MSTMKCIVKAKPEPGGLEFQERPIPKAGPGQVVIKQKAVSICGTDLHIYNWDAWSQNRVSLPCILGHEFAGHVSDVGPNVNHVKEGDYVSGEGHLVCGVCQQCRTGMGHVCESWKGLGYDIDGAFCEYLLFPASGVVHNDPDVDPAMAAIQDPLGNAVHTVFAQDCVAKKVAVFGLGPVGALSVAVLRAIGADTIFAVGRRNQYRIDLAKACGAHHVIAGAEIDPVAYIMDHTDGKGVDVCLEISGNPKAFQNALDVVKDAGHISVIGTSNDKYEVDFAKDVVFKAVNIHGITGRMIWDTWYKMKGLFASGNLDVSKVITHRMPYADYEKGFEIMQSGNCGKVVLDL